MKLTINQLRFYCFVFVFAMLTFLTIIVLECRQEKIDVSLILLLILFAIQLMVGTYIALKTLRIMITQKKDLNSK